MKIVIIIVLVLAIVLGVAFYFIAPSLMNNGQTENQPVTLTMWGLWEEDQFLKPAIEQYQKDNPNVTINYIRQTPTNYRTRAQTQIGANEGPDILMIHNSWLPMFLQSQSLSPLPESVMSGQEYTQSFNKVVLDSLSSNNQVYGMARGIDGIAMYYNEDILRGAGVTEVPQTWPAFTDAAIRTTVRETNGTLKTAGAAMGTTGNVDHWSDILGLLFYQNPGASLETPATNEGAEVIRFYTNFVTNGSQKTWDANIERSTMAFAAGKLAFYFAPSWRAFELKALNPNLNFKTAPVPQLPGRSVSWATFWAYGVSSKSVSPEESWKFLKYLTSASVQQQLYQEASSVRLFGLPYSQVSIQPELSQDPVVGSFVNQAPNYKSWYLSTNTFDQGINDEIIKYYEDAVNSVVFEGANPLNVLQTTQEGVKQVLDKYKNPPTAPATQ